MNRKDLPKRSRSMAAQGDSHSSVLAAALTWDVEVLVE